MIQLVTKTIEAVMLFVKWATVDFELFLEIFGEVKASVRGSRNRRENEIVTKDGEISGQCQEEDVNSDLPESSCSIFLATCSVPQ